MSYGKVYLVGAGPGDIELVTLKAARLVAEGDVICYDHLIPLELLDRARPDAEVISVGKFAAKHTLPQDKINALLIEKAKEGKIVVRLKGGDPYLFGRGGEEAQDCVEAGVEFEVVPGVTSALAAACYGGIPPTHRDFTPHVAIITGHRKEGRKLDIPEAGTLIFLMGVKNISRIISSLLEAGKPADTPIAAIEHGTRYDQRVITGTLENFEEKLKQAQPRTPAIFIVGKVVELQQTLDWFGKKPNVLVMGNHPQRYAYLGNIVHRRIIDCVAVDDYTEADETIKHIAEFNWIVFTSVNGAKYLFERLATMKLDARALANAKIAAIGKTTAQRLREYGITADLVPQDESSAGLVEEFKKLDVSGSKVLFPQAEVASKVLPAGLTELGATVEAAVVYKTIDIEPPEVDFDYIDKILFTSGSTVRAFARHYGKMPENTEALALGIPTQQEAKKHGIEAGIIPPKPNCS